ncbi:unnamed protein product [Adineta ricciae]|uniref:Uncharacterized protein n=1 Tax=Adineta ricciae TaxID=249248 RepID=A0A814DMU1_ADIRI|nr:unnamed protein product [Adineta ricciae]CAF0974682.1 unnamed protein product [Adineta ricciae]
MQICQYCLFLLAFVVVIIHSRFIERSLDNDQDDEFYYPSNYYLNRAYRSHALERYLRSMLADDDDAIPFERRGKSITKGDPREFMG